MTKMAKNYSNPNVFFDHLTKWCKETAHSVTVTVVMTLPALHMYMLHTHRTIDFHYTNCAPDLYIQGPTEDGVPLFYFEQGLQKLKNDLWRYKIIAPQPDGSWNWDPRLSLYTEQTPDTERTPDQNVW
jgi:hypothetical protein